ncbi:MAG: dTDP-4-dehydrorhamnose 3,5-epimerase [Alphaproteobacteria bacterium]|nr:dTDP-4-dehydrorhamnose 3,5-epimerase [Alphaproteobacteria bacterium]
MKAIPTKLSGVLVLEPKIYGDTRGFFFESYNTATLRDLLERDYTFVQDNHSHSTKDVLRGLHYQIQHPQGKLVRVGRGHIFDVVVDIRKTSPTFGQWGGFHLSEDNHLELWIPPGFAHGFVVLSNEADLLYKTTDYYSPLHERCIIWNDPTIGIDWPIDFSPIISAKDALGVPFPCAEVFVD